MSALAVLDEEHNDKNDTGAYGHFGKQTLKGQARRADNAAC